MADDDFIDGLDLSGLRIDADKNQVPPGQSPFAVNIDLPSDYQVGDLERERAKKRTQTVEELRKISQENSHRIAQRTYEDQAKDRQLEQRGRGEHNSPIVNPHLDYWCGAQAQIFFDDIFIDELYAFQYETITNRSPVYGYASRLFDTVAEGNLVVSGTFAINFIHQNYLMSALRKDGPLKADKRRFEIERAPLMEDAEFGHGPRRRRNFSDYRRTFKQLSQFKKQQALNQLKNKGNDEWVLLNHALITSPRPSRTTHLKGLSTEGGGMMTIEGLTQETLTGRWSLPGFQNSGFFDIYLTFTDPAQTTSVPTLKRISQAAIISQGMMVNSSGEPILETYRFLARDIN